FQVDLGDRILYLPLPPTEGGEDEEAPGCGGGGVCARARGLSGRGSRAGSAREVNVDLDHGLAFPQNKQNEPAITRDPVTGALVAGANDEISLDPCRGTTAPLASPCPFTPGRPISAFYRSTNGGQSWTGGYLPGFD